MDLYSPRRSTGWQPRKHAGKIEQVFLTDTACPFKQDTRFIISCPLFFIWQKDDGTKVYSYQVNVSEIGPESEKPREQQQPQSPARPEPPMFAEHEEFDYQGEPF